MNSEEADKLERHRKYVRLWLEREKKAKEVIPYVQRYLEVTEWEIGALNDRPKEAYDLPLVGLTDKLDRDFAFLTETLPMIPDYDTSKMLNLTSVLTSGSANMYQLVNRASDLGTLDAQIYSAKYVVAYAALQESHNRPTEVRALLQNLNSQQTLERFDRALSKYLEAKSGIGERTSAALEMRNLLDGVQGDLFARARNWSKENMTWEEMARRLSKGAPGGAEQQELLDQNRTRVSLINRLSEVLKDREGGSLTNIDSIWIEVLDHTYVVLGLVNFATKGVG